MNLGPGWSIDESILIDLIKDDSGKFLNEAAIERKLCDLDLRDIGQPVISNCIHKDKQMLIGPIVLQISKYRNVCFPKLYQESHQNPGIIRIFLTDGHSSISALILESINGINADTPSGTKIRIIGNVPMEGNFILLDRKNIVILGGRVDKLFEKWIIEKNSGQGGRKNKSQAPKWVSFNQKNCKMISESPQEFKANDIIHAATKKSVNDNSQFEQQRKETIEAIEEKTTKKFAAPNIPVPPMKHRSTEYNKNKDQISNRGSTKKGRRGRKGSNEEESTMEISRPSAPCTLFDFVANNVQTKLAESQEPEKTFSKFSDRQPERSGQRNDWRKKVHGRSNYSQSGGICTERMNNISSCVTKQGKEQRSGKVVNIVEKKQRFDFGPVNKIRHSTERLATGKPEYGADNFSAIQEDTMKALLNMRIGNYSQSWNDVERVSSDRRRMNDRKEVSTWKVGDQCRAPWTDGEYYLATVVNLGPADMCTVRYNVYGNVGTVPQAVLILP